MSITFYNTDKNWQAFEFISQPKIKHCKYFSYIGYLLIAEKGRA